jgi:CO/xanthine dehydrogenase FAD-binding subunit
MKPAPFRYADPSTVAETLDLLAEYGDDAKIIAGGQSLMPLLAFRLARPSALIDLRSIPMLDGVDRVEDGFSMRCMATHHAVEAFSGPGISQAIRTAIGHVGHRGIRNRGTVGGSLAHADPSAEWASIALAHDGMIGVRSRSRHRNIDANDFFTGLYTTALEPDELLETLTLRLPSGAVGSGFCEFSRRQGDFALAGALTVLQADDSGTVVHARIALFGVEVCPTRRVLGEEALLGVPPSEPALRDATRAALGGLEPRGADDSERRYRVQLAEVMIERALDQAARQLPGRDHADG